MEHFEEVASDIFFLKLRYYKTGPLQDARDDSQNFFFLHFLCGECDKGVRELWLGKEDVRVCCANEIFWLMLIINAH